jgi:hypothetical protein
VVILALNRIADAGRQPSPRIGRSGLMSAMGIFHQLECIMADSTHSYDEFAAHYDQIFKSWEASIVRQTTVPIFIAHVTVETRPSMGAVAIIRQQLASPASRPSFSSYNN